MIRKKHSTAHTHLHTRLSADEAIAAFIVRHFRSASRPVIIAIGGPGGSGKTSFAKKLQRHLPSSGIINLDNYKTSRSERQLRGLAGPHPDANRMELVGEHLGQIKSGNSVAIPIYNGETGDIGSYEEYRPQKFTIAEGEISTYPPFRKLVDIAIFIDADLTTQLAARTGRDVKVRGHSLKKAITTFLTSNLTDFTIYGAEGKEWADIHMFCHEDYHYTLEAVNNDLLAGFQTALGDGTVISPEGCIVPLATPFEKNLSLCQTAFIDHLSYLKTAGVGRILVGGTTAEFFSLTIAERLTLLKLSREYFPGFIMFNISADSLSSTKECAKRVTRYGADALICLPPYYYAGAPADGLVRYFSSIAEVCERPFYLYNFPKHTGNPLTPEIIRQIPHAGIKDSSADLSLIPHAKSYLLGGDSKIIETYKAGGCGFIPGLPNVFPTPYLQLETALDSNNIPQAEEITGRIQAFKQTLPKVSGIVVIKQYLNRRIKGYPVTVRPPMSSANSEALDISQTLV